MMPDNGLKPVENDLKRIVHLEFHDKNRLSSFLNRPSLNDEELGIKCMAFNPMRNQLAIGDMVGNIRIYQLNQENQVEIN